MSSPCDFPTRLFLRIKHSSRCSGNEANRRPRPARGGFLARLSMLSHRPLLPQCAPLSETNGEDIHLLGMACAARRASAASSLLACASTMARQLASAKQPIYLHKISACPVSRMHYVAVGRLNCLRGNNPRAYRQAIMAHQARHHRKCVKEGGRIEVHRLLK